MMWRAKKRLVTMALVAMAVCTFTSACNTVISADGGASGLPPTLDPEPVRVLYVGNLCAGCADTHLAQMAASLNQPRAVEVDSVVIPTY